MNKTLIGVGVSVLTIILCLFCLEIGVRVLYPQTTSMYLSDPDVGFTHHPSSYLTVVTPEYTYHYTTNTEGFVDYDHDLKSSEPRIAFIGDSFTAAIQVEQKDSFSRVIEQEMGVETFNFGVSATGTTQHYEILRKFALKYNPAYVVLLFYAGNDVVDNSLDHGFVKERPFYKVEGELVRVHDPEIQSREVELFTDWVATNIQSLMFVSNSLKTIQQGSKTDIKGLTWEDKIFLVDPEVKKAFEQDFEVTEKLLLEMKKQVETNNGKFMVFVIPPVWAADPAVGDEFLRKHELESEEVNFDFVNDWVMGVCEKNDIECYEFEFHKTTDPSTLHYQVDKHWNSLGHKLAAAKIEEVLIRKL